MENILSTSTGRQYRVELPDGSTAWLNAASSIQYPAGFSSGERKASITGEVYFEIQSDRDKPFTLRVRGLEILVLGTSFNVKAYDDEDAIVISLVEGALKIRSDTDTRLLLTGQQMLAERNGSLRLIRDADLDAATAWKNGQ